MEDGRSKFERSIEAGMKAGVGNAFRAMYESFARGGKAR